MRCRLSMFQPPRASPRARSAEQFLPTASEFSSSLSLQHRLEDFGIFGADCAHGEFRENLRAPEEPAETFLDSRHAPIDIETIEIRRDANSSCQHRNFHRHRLQGYGPAPLLLGGNDEGVARFVKRGHLRLSKPGSQFWICDTRGNKQLEAAVLNCLLDQRESLIVIRLAHKADSPRARRLEEIRNGIRNVMDWSAISGDVIPQHRTDRSHGVNQ